MKTLYQKGDVLDYVAGTNISSGDVVVAGKLVGVATVDIASGDTGSVLVEGVVDLPKDGVTPFAVGDLLDWNGTICVAAIGGDIAGKVFKAALAADTTVSVKLAG